MAIQVHDMTLKKEFFDMIGKTKWFEGRAQDAKRLAIRPFDYIRFKCEDSTDVIVVRVMYILKFDNIQTMCKSLHSSLLPGYGYEKSKDVYDNIPAYEGKSMIVFKFQ